MQDNVRKFWLTNANGDTYSLHENNVILTNPAGLGFSRSISMAVLGNSNAILSKSYDLASLPFSGEIDFIGSTNVERYKEYNDFSKFLYFEPLELHYKVPFDGTPYFCKVIVSNLEKTETGQDGIMRVNIQLTKQTSWYSEEKNQIEARERAYEGKQYPLRRPYHYGVVSTKNVKLYNAGVSETPMLVEIVGNVEDPSFSLYDSNNVQYGAAKLTGVYDYVAINSDDLEEEIVLQRSGATIPNAVNYQDLTVGNPQQVYVTFLKLKPGTSTLVFNTPTDFTGFCRVTWRNAYATV